VVRALEIVRPDGEIVRRKPIVGDMKWDGKKWLRWSGRSWASAAYSFDAELLLDRARLDTRPPISQEKRARALELAVEDQVATNAATVVFSGSQGVVLGYQRRVSHVFHALMTLFTAGLWAVIWLAVMLSSRERRVRLEADRWGNVWARPVAGR
jgi:hypothetical protein